jgi:predicted nucleotidyltransferase
MLENLFTSKNRVKILLFLLFEKSETYIREVSNLTKISPGAVKKEMDNLNSMGIIYMKKGKIELNQDCMIIQDLKNIFIKTDYIFEPIKSAIKEAPIKFAVIFGSIATGKDKTSSDVDLLIISNLKQDKIFNMLRIAEKSIGREINTIVWSFETLTSKVESALIRDIKKKGFLVLKGDENEFRRIIK